MKCFWVLSGMKSNKLCKKRATEGYCQFHFKTFKSFRGLISFSFAIDKQVSFDFQSFTNNPWHCLFNLQRSPAHSYQTISSETAFSWFVLGCSGGVSLSIMFPFDFSASVISRVYQTRILWMSYPWMEILLQLILVTSRSSLGIYQVWGSWIWNEYQ